MADREFSTAHNSISVKSCVSNSIFSSSVPVTSKRRAVHKTATKLQEILNPDHDVYGVFLKYAWRYPHNVLCDLAKEAVKSDTRGNPTKLFNWLVKVDLGYERKG